MTVKTLWKKWQNKKKNHIFCSCRMITWILLISLAVTALIILNFDKKISAFKDNGQCFISDDSEKFDCYPHENGNREKCEERGCCWVPRGPGDVPWCFYPRGYGGYKYMNVTPSDRGVIAYLMREFPSPYPRDVLVLRMQVEYQTNYRLRIKIDDPCESRFESPYPVIEEMTTDAPKTMEYIVDISKDDSGFAVKRSDGGIIFDTRSIGGFIFSDQFLQLSGRFEGEMYGLGEHRSTIALNQNWTKWTMWNKDIVPVENMNLYGSHPFYLLLEPNGTAHGVFLKNSNAMDVIVQPLPAITFRTIGGVLDFYFFMGPTPADVIAQYTEFIGRPGMPPYWSLGFHLCRLGYKNSSHMLQVLHRNLDAGIPVDTQWVDIDYMLNRNDFTLNEEKFGDLPKVVKELHSNGMRFVPILDPGISAGETDGSYPPFDEGKRLKVLVKNQDGSPFIGKVWNKNSTAFPDFTDVNTLTYWANLTSQLHEVLPFDGLWIDMNEPSNFLDGSLTGCADNNWEHPPYVPGDIKLYTKTLCMSSVHSVGTHYSVHNLYGISEAHVTNRVLTKILGVRPLIISRSTFPGIGRYAGHWSGDVASTWHDMKMTVSQMLAFSMLGVPLMGSDICGFNGNTTKYLCMRWSQLGAFYPFSRNHNTDDANDQDPAAFGDEVLDAAKNALTVRYTLLPYLYTLFWLAHSAGETVARPLFFEFPKDPNTYKLDECFLWGSSILIVPVLEDQATTVTTYVPDGTWYDWYSYMGFETQGVNKTFHASSDTIPVLIRGGAVVPIQRPALNTFSSRKNQMSLIAAYNRNLTASGNLFWDDGESLDVKVTKAYGWVEFVLTADGLTSLVRHWNTPLGPTVEGIKILGFVRQVKIVQVNGVSCPFYWNSTNLVLSLNNLHINVNQSFSITWN